MNCREWRKQQ